MSDIVERLRATDDLAGCYADHHIHSMAEAAAEIERLRAALGRIGHPGKSIIYCRDGHEEAILIARQALKGGE